MGERKLEKFPVQLLALTAIMVDHAIQSRVSTSMDYQREFSEAMLRGDVFPPVTVFFDGKKYWLADGFHRYGAAKQAARANPRLKGAIRAEVREGTRRDAMVFSAGANIKFSIPRTAEDIKKAVWMLLEDEEWFGKSDSAIAKHVGVGGNSVGRTRVAFCAERHITVPERVVDARGHSVSIRRPGKRLPKLQKRKRDGCRDSYHIVINGRKHSLGVDREVAQERYNEILRERAASRPIIDNHSIYNILAQKHVNSKSVDLPSGSFPSLYSLTVLGLICTAEPFEKPGDAIAAIGRAVVLGKHFNLPAPAIVICYPDEGPAEILALGRQLGIEFLTPEELVERVKSQEHPPADS